jgi:anti-sigma-K factor RskA
MADLYCLGKLKREEARAFEEHFRVCAKCAEAVWVTQTLIEALRQSQEETQGRTSD